MGNVVPIDFIDMGDGELINALMSMIWVMVYSLMYLIWGMV